MKLLEGKAFPKIEISPSGKILHMNTSARKAFSSLDLGQSIFEIIDADAIRKLSMYKKRLEIVKTSALEYPTVALKSNGRSRTKSIEATFLNLSPSDISFDMVSALYSEKNLPKSNTCVDICEIARYTIDELLARKELLDLNVQVLADEPSFVKLGAPQAELLLLTVVTLLAEINPNSSQDIKIQNAILEFSINSNSPYSITSPTELLMLYPQLSSKLLLIEAICEDEFIALKARAVGGKLKITFEIPAGAKNELIVKASLTSAKERICAFIDTLSH